MSCMRLSDGALQLVFPFDSRRGPVHSDVGRQPRVFSPWLAACVMVSVLLLGAGCQSGGAVGGCHRARGAQRPPLRSSRAQITSSWTARVRQVQFALFSEHGLNTCSWSTWQDAWRGVRLSVLLMYKNQRQVLT